MATVRISKELLSTIEANIEAVRGRVYAATVKPLIPTIKPEDDHEFWASAVSDVLWGQYAHLRDQIPTEWCRTVGHFNVKLVSPDAHAAELRYEFQYVNPSLLCPPNTSSYGAKAVIDLSTCPESVQAYVAAKAAHDAALQELNSKFSALTAQITGFVRASKSLNDAVKNFPNIKLYLTDGLLAELDRVEVRAKRGAKPQIELPPHIDTDLIASIGVMGKMLQAA